ncbi:MAG TPA: hypothetical protein VGM81_03185 [Burkholderiaceae bacterium]|jgi:hypothetical protein
MSLELTEARKWVQRARELLGKGRRQMEERELLDLQEGLLKFAKDPAVLRNLAPELTTALEELAGALSGSEGEGESEDVEGRKLFEELRKDLALLRKALVNVLKPEEASALELALELADNHALLGQFETAGHLLQQAGHRARDIRDEGREGGLVAVVDEDAVKATQRRQEDEAGFRKASQVIAVLVARLDPMSKLEKQQCSLFALTVYNCVAAERYDNALLVLEEWRKALELLLAKDSESQARRERVREQQALEQAALDKLAKPGLDVAMQKIRDDVALARAPLIKMSTEITAWKAGKPHALEGRIGALEFEVERQLNGLKPYVGRAPLAQDEQKICARLLVKAEAASLLMQQAETAARKELAEARKTFEDEVAQRKEKLGDYLAVADKKVADQELQVENKRKAVAQSLEAGKLLKNTDGRALANPLTATSLDFYEKTVARLNLVKKKSEEEQKLLTLAGKVVQACKAHALLEQALSGAEKSLETLETERSQGRKPLEALIEDAKLPLAITWAAPADIVYGTPLSATQLNARLSADSGTIHYTLAGKAIEPEKTVLPAGAGQRLRAAVVGADAEVYRTVVPVEVPLNVLKAKTTVSCKATTLEYGYGTPWRSALLGAGVATEPASEGEHADLLSGLEILLEGKALKEGNQLDAKVHALKVRSPGNKNFEPSAEVAVSLTVKPAQQEIVWEGAAPQTQTFPAALTALQLNARVTISTDPPLADRLSDLSKALEYVDDKGQAVKVGSVLGAGDARRITVRTPARVNFLAAAEKTLTFKVDKAVRTLAMAAPPAIGAIVQSNDMKKLRAKASFNPGDGEAQFFIEKLELAVGAKPPAGKKRKLRVAAKPDDNYQLTDEREVEVDVLSVAEKLDGAKKSNTDLQLKRVHSTQMQSLDALRLEAEKGGTDEQKFAHINALMEEVDEIEAKIVGWKAEVKVAAPKGEAKTLQVVIQEDDTTDEDVKTERRVKKTVEVLKKLVKHGGVSLGDIENLIPKGTPNVYHASPKYPKGFRYEWTTPSGVKMVIYGHGPTNSKAVHADADSKKGNLVRMTVNGDYVQPDGNLIDDAFDASSHMALY